MRVVSQSSSLMDIMAEVSEMSVASWSSERPTAQVHLLAKLKSESARKRQQVVSNERSLHQIVACLKPLGVSELSSWSALISRIAGCGPACPVVWEGASARGLPIPLCKGHSGQSTLTMTNSARGKFGLPVSSARLDEGNHDRSCASPLSALIRWLSP